MTENQKNNPFEDSFENSFEDSFEDYDYADQMALMDIWYEQQCFEDLDYSSEEYYYDDDEFEEENPNDDSEEYSEVDSEITQNDSEYQLYSDYCQEFIQKIMNQ